MVAAPRRRCRCVQILLGVAQTSPCREVSGAICSRLLRERFSSPGKNLTGRMGRLREAPIVKLGDAAASLRRARDLLLPPSAPLWTDARRAARRCVDRAHAQRHGVPPPLRSRRPRLGRPRIAASRAHGSEQVRAFCLQGRPAVGVEHGGRPPVLGLGSALLDERPAGASDDKAF